ncbi:MULTISPECIES: hypothetical protein [Herbaspirillum]|uniref:hypothetical protein n=1 Tax=Herbaspirillum TaxID=963 RepID=UPI0003490AC4|nr:MULTISPECIES: hypothetical protein [Herbaspirillum]MCP1575954.1 hypothetical protein [Herbaspirillum rubrisubalbicans]
MRSDAPHDDAPTLTYVQLWQGAEVLIRKGGEEEAGSRWVFLSALLMLSLCLEAYLNHVGPLLFGASWSEGDQAPATKDAKARLRLVCAACGVALEAPHKYRTVALTLLELRASLAEATQVRLPPLESEQRRGAEPDPAWSPYCRRNVVLDYRSQLRLLLGRLQAGLPAQARSSLLI